MADTTKSEPQEQQPSADAAPAPAPAAAPVLEGGTYEVIRARLAQHAAELRARSDRLDQARRQAFGTVETKLLTSARVSTQNNCTPRDMVPLGNTFLFGYNVFIGLRAETKLDDVFAVYRWSDGQFAAESLELIADERFIADFRNLYRYYRTTTFARFAIIGPHLFMVFQIGADPNDIKTFKWLIRGDKLEYVDNRSDHECVFPPQHEFEWTRATRAMHREGLHPHISIDDRLFVETIGGDLTVKIEDNTASGEGIYSEPVDNPDQTLDDAEIYFAIVENLILLKIRPYQEQAFRCLVYSEKVHHVTRVDTINDACVLLPDGHGLVFPNGYYLQTGELKLFSGDNGRMLFEHRIASPNGEDHLFVFYNPNDGLYLLLSYNVIRQQVATPIVCSGYCFFSDGTLNYFRAADQPTRHHVIQVWQTPYCSPDQAGQVSNLSQAGQVSNLSADNPQVENLRHQESLRYLQKIGNREVVRCMAECSELLSLVGKPESYANLYVDIARSAQDIRDAYFWLGHEAVCNLAEPLAGIQAAAASAIDEFEKVVRTRRESAREVARVAARIDELVKRIDYNRMTEVDDYVSLLADFRAVRGEVASLGQLRYVDADAVASLDKQVAERTDELSGRCVEFLLKPDSLKPYHARVYEHEAALAKVGRAAEARSLDEQLVTTSRELETLSEVVGNLKIDDATQTTAIIDAMSLVHQRLNRVKSSLKSRQNELGRAEGQAEFASQLKLLEQTVAGYMDLCDTPAKCDDCLTRAMVQLESLEAKFAEFDDFVVRLAEKRTEVYDAFEGRKVQLVEARNRRASALLAAGERILKGIRNRVEGMTDLNAINGYFAGDMMVERLRETVRQLDELGDTVKAEDLRNQLKSVQQESIRQLKDRQALYEDGESIIRLGSHRFAVNRQPLELTVVNRDGRMCLHLAGTGFFEPITDEEFLATGDVWDVEAISESPRLYRAEYLAGLMLRQAEADGPDALKALAANGAQPPSAVNAGAEDGPARLSVLSLVQQFAAGRYADGYVKGVHDADAAAILHGLISMRMNIGLLRYPPGPRTLASLFWRMWNGDPAKKTVAAQMSSLGELQRLFGPRERFEDYVAELRTRIEAFVSSSGLFDANWSRCAAEYLFNELAGGQPFIVSRPAVEMKDKFLDHLKRKRFTTRFTDALSGLTDDPLAAFRLCRDWLRAWSDDGGAGFQPADDGQVGNLPYQYIDEVAALLTDNATDRPVVAAETSRELTGLLGVHPRIVSGRMTLAYCDFIQRFDHHERNVVPAFQRYHEVRKRLIDRRSEQLRLTELKSQVLSTFVRNRLIDRVFLPLLGDNLAKQIGAAGDAKRTDRQGLLLLISPPGYGKTTLMEYLANRLGLTFVKVNGPAIGNRVGSLDPAEAPNAASRQEVERLNLAFELGDNVMIYLDDIQHCSAELLQKFIPLCDAQRRIEGVNNGRVRTYDLRGKRVCVVMAGNPYTESGQKFRIPDMLANRADVCNIGDIVGDNKTEFIDSYIENCLTSNVVLARLAQRSQADVYSVMRLAAGEPPENVQFESTYSPDELTEYVATMKKLFVVRQIVLAVNREYIRSAGTADAFRTEPPFLLQGSYRNMNRIAARVLPVMNDLELWTVIMSAYEQDAQTLTSGAMNNLLKFKELAGRLTEDEKARWDEVKRTFRRQQLLGGTDDDKVSQVIRQLNAFAGGLDTISATLDKGVAAIGKRQEPPPSAGQPVQAVAAQVENLSRQLEGIRAAMEKAGEAGCLTREEFRSAGQAVLDRLSEVIAAVRQESELEHETARRHEALTINDNAQTLVAVLEEQFKMVETWLEPIERSEAGRVKYVGELIDRFETMVAGYNRLIDVLKGRQPVTPELLPDAAVQAPPVPPVVPPPPPSAGKSRKTRPRQAGN